MSRQLRITLTDEEYSLLEPIAKRWGRPASEVAVEFFRRGFPGGVAQYRQLVQEADCWVNATSDRPHYRSLAHAIHCNWDKLQGPKLKPERLAAIRDGNKPTETELLRLALALGVAEEYLEALPQQDQETTNAVR
uniref:hypothetical protein n=1 Tax=Trichocoleus desertorum TaxID=1481672 RepID=UPI0025B4B29E|nr:hypothetical protein [Trichocoleus desertorum]